MQQVNTWANVDLDPCRHMASLDHNELTNISSFALQVKMSNITRYNF